MVDLILQRLLNQIRPIVFIHIDLTFNLFERVMALLIGLLVDLIALFGDCVLIVGVVLVEVELLRHVEVDRSVGPLLSCSDDSPQFLKTLFSSLWRSSVNCCKRSDIFYWLPLSR